jgi:hypothetical protein
MPAVPIKPEYGPTLGRLLAPRWNRSSRWVQALAVAAGLFVLALGIGLALTLESAQYSHGGSVPFSFAYKYMWRVPPEPGGYVRVQARYPDGSLKYSFAVNPLELPPYHGEQSGALPVYAAAYADRLKTRFPDVVLRGQGKTRTNGMPGYEVLYTTTIDGREMYGRNILLLPEGAGVRKGVEIVMQAARGAESGVEEPLEVASTEGAVLLRPLKTFSFG